MESWTRMCSALRFTRDQLLAAANERRRYEFTPAEARNIANNLSTMVDVVDVAVASAERLRQANDAEAGNLTDWSERLSAYARNIEQRDPDTAAVIIGLAGAVNEMAVARQGRP